MAIGIRMEQRQHVEGPRADSDPAAVEQRPALVGQDLQRHSGLSPCAELPPIRPAARPGAGCRAHPCPQRIGPRSGGTAAPG